MTQNRVCRERAPLDEPLSFPNQETHTMSNKIQSRLTIVGLVILSFLAAMIALSLLPSSRADDPPAANPDEFSPYVTKEGGISLPSDYREKFLHLGTFAVASQAGKPVDEMHNVYGRRVMFRPIGGTAGFRTARSW